VNLNIVGVIENNENGYTNENAVLVNHAKNILEKRRDIYFVKMNKACYGRSRNFALMDFYG